MNPSNLRIALPVLVLFAVIALTLPACGPCGDNADPVGELLCWG